MDIPYCGAVMQWFALALCQANICLPPPQAVVLISIKSLHASDMALKYFSKSPFSIKRHIILILPLHCFHILQKQSLPSVVIMTSNLHNRFIISERLRCCSLILLFMNQCPECVPPFSNDSWKGNWCENRPCAYLISKIVNILLNQENIWPYFPIIWCFKNYTIFTRI